MNTFDAIYQRRSIKQYDSQHKLSQEEETKLLEAAIQAPPVLTYSTGVSSSCAIPICGKKSVRNLETIRLK